MLVEERYPLDGRSVGIEIIGNAASDGEDHFWSTEPGNLRRQFARQIQERITTREIVHLSVFALAPIPLLVELGHLLCDIVPADIYQLHREPTPGWQWARTGPRIEFDVNEPQQKLAKVALKIGVSATINDSRITSVMGDDVSIWSLTARTPGNDVMRYPEDLENFRRNMRSMYDRIKSEHGERAEIHLFPAVPVSVAVEIGRVRLPKADLPVVVYDQLPNAPFTRRLMIGAI
jgi:hypothetical protein